jgi:hypothetical protein
MRTAAGRPNASEVPEPLKADDVERFAQVLHAALGTRRDRHRNLVAWAAAVAAAPPGPLRVPALAAAASASPKQLRHVIEHAPLDEVLLRWHLIKAAPLARVLAFTVEHDSVLHAESDTELDLFSLHAIGRNWTVPIGWVVQPIPPAELDGFVIGVDDSEADAVVELLSQMSEDYAAVEPAVLLGASGPPPVILLAESLGINKGLRERLRATIGEYVALVPATYSDVELAGEPLDRVEPDRQLQDYFAPIPLDADPPPRELLDQSRVRRGREYAVPLRGEGRLSYAIARPLPHVPSDGLLGKRPEQRARELARLALEVGDSHAASRLRVTDLRHRNPDVVRRHALVMSMLTSVVDDGPIGVHP